MADNSLFLIDIDKILQTKTPKHFKYIPKFVVSYLKRIVHQEELNAFLRDSKDKVGVGFLGTCLEFLDAELDVKGLGNIPKDGLYTFVSNRPLGGQDGVPLGYILGRRFDGEVKCLVNDLLMSLRGLTPLCIPINKTGKQVKDFPKMVEAGFKSDDRLIMFPAGLCSRRRNGVIRDPDWKKTFIIRSVQFQRDVIPVHFEGRNSDFSYNLANICKTLGIRFNIAMLCLADEMLKNHRKAFTVTFGKPIPWQTFDKSKTPAEWAQYVKDVVYKLQQIKEQLLTEYMEGVIEPVSKELIRAELTEDKQLRIINKSNNQIYIITYQGSPNIMREIGRLREIAFRAAGGDTGLSMDIDEYDTMENPYKQLIVWNPEVEEVLGGYRYVLRTDVRFDEHGVPVLATSHMFNFSDKFVKESLPTTIELGRSFVTLEYQSTRAGSKGLFALDNLWDGLGALIVVMPNVKYFFGKATMYSDYHRRRRDVTLCFLKKHFGDKDGPITPMKPFKMEIEETELARIFRKDSFKDDYRILNGEIRKLGFNIPPLVDAYMSLSPTMRVFGTTINYRFGDVEETGTLVAVDGILEEKRMRHIESFVKSDPKDCQITPGVNKVFTPKVATPQEDCSR